MSRTRKDQRKHRRKSFNSGRGVIEHAKRGQRRKKQEKRQKEARRNRFRS